MRFCLDSINEYPITQGTEKKKQTRIFRILKAYLPALKPQQ